MAIRHNWNFKGIEVQGCYVRVAQISCNKQQGNAFIEFKVNQASDPFETKPYQFGVELNGANFIAQAYDHLKTLPEFAGSTDC
jgi:hypothetical protein